jgi:hypothetical protein
MIPRTSHRKGSRYKGTNLGNSVEDDSIYDGTEKKTAPGHLEANCHEGHGKLVY